MLGLPLRSTLSRLALASAAVGAALLPAACDNQTTAPVKVAAGNVTAAVNSSTVAAVSGKTFTFPNGGGALSPALANQTVSLAFTSSGSSTTAVITTPAGNIPANVTFGSCIFTTTAVSALGPVGTVLTVNPCSITINSNGLPATGATVNATVTMSLGAGQPSTPVTVPIQISTSGTVTVTGTNGAGIPVGTTTTTNATGS